MRTRVLACLSAAVGFCLATCSVSNAQPNIVGSLASFERSHSESIEQLDGYTQRITIAFRDAETAGQAKVEIAPLFDDFYRAVSCRWDDNGTSDNEVTRDVMEEYGIRGTWYLNDQSFSPSGEPADYLPTAKRLLSGGNTVGGHSLTHPFLTYFHSHRMFAEMSGVRIAWEAMLDQPVVSYAYSFIDLRPEPEGREVLQRSLLTLQNSGYSHIAEYINFFSDVDLDLELSPIMPPENNPFEVFESAVDWAYDDARLTEFYPMISNSMHAWYGTPRLEYGYDELRKRFEVLANLDKVWHCNQNQYAAYRRQFRFARLIREGRVGNELHFRLIRPSLLALNNDVPLTLVISNVASEQIAGVECGDALIVESERESKDRCAFHVGHSRHQRLPLKIAHIPNPTNRPPSQDFAADPDFPSVYGAMFVRGGHVNLEMRCDGQQMLDDVRVVWRTPIGWRVDKTLQRSNSIGREGLLLSQPLLPVGDQDLRWGQAHFAAQVDFVHGTQAGRIHFTCQLPGEVPDVSLPLDHFSVLGPIPNDQWSTDEFVEKTARDGECALWPLESGSLVKWRTHAQDGYVNQEWLNPEYVRTMGTWDNVSPTYVIRSSVHSPRAQSARMMTSHAALRTVLLNGHPVDSDLVELREGDNRLVIVYPGCTLSVETQRLAACFVRLADPDTGQRLRNIRYRAY